MTDSEPTPEHAPAREVFDSPTVPSMTAAMDEPDWTASAAPHTASPSHVDSQPRRQSRRQSRRVLMGCWAWFRASLAILAMALSLVVVTVAVIGLVIYSSLADELREDIAALQSMEGVEDFQTTRIYARDGTLLYEVFDEGRRTEVPLDQIPFAVRWATIDTEDDTFYENPGFDPPSIARAAYHWYREGEIVSGGSTLTQQLVRQIVFTYEERNEQTLRRKLKEAALAWVMTRSYSKDEILELYLNEVYYGNLAYGIESAADVYFDKHARDLTMAESAFLAGLVQSPVAYDPYVNFEAAKARQRQVLDLMVLRSRISQAEADALFAERPVLPSDLANPDVSLVAPHYTVAVRNELATIPGIEPEDIARGGLRVYTALSLEMQELGEGIAREQVAAIGEEANLHNASLVAINPNTGEVLAMIGSIDYYDESIDGNVNVALSPQQPGSAMKPLTYAAALEQGWTPATIIWDVPMAYADGQGDFYEPVNYDGRFHGPVRMRDALANSYNIPAVETLNQIGVASLLEIAHRFGIDSLEDDPALYGLSLTLGGGDVQPIELTAAYGVFASGGYKVTPHLITRVEDSAGNVIYAAPTERGERVLDAAIAFQISSILSDNAARTPAMGDDSPLYIPDFPAAAKTGTTNDFRDNWTVGYTPHLVVGVWAGNTDNSQMAEGTSGLTGAAPIWHDFMTAVYADPELTALLEGQGLPPLRAEFTPPEGMEQRQVCVLSSLRDPAPVQAGCPRLRAEWFRVPKSQDLLLTPTVQPTPTWTPRPTVEGLPPAEQLPYVRVEIEQGIWGIAVLPMNDERAARLLPMLDGFNAARPEDTPVLASPPYCEIPQEFANAQDTSFQLFIEAPADPAAAIRARNFAWANGWPIVPGLPCPLEVLQLQPTPIAGAPPVGITYSIRWPEPNQGVYGVVPILGTAAFDPALVQFYKIEISGGSLDGWVTLGDTHTQSVNDGVLEVLHADALPAGQYIIRLILVGHDGNYIQPTFDVPIIVLSEPPTATPSPSPTATP